jgi:hypothetical protein
MLSLLLPFRKIIFSLPSTWLCKPQLPVGVNTRFCLAGFCRLLGTLFRILVCPFVLLGFNLSRLDVSYLTFYKRCRRSPFLFSLEPFKNCQ